MRVKHYLIGLHAAFLLVAASSSAGQAGEGGHAIPRTEALSQPLARSGFAQLVAISPDGERAASAENGRIRYLRTRDKKVEKTFYACAPLALIFSSDSKFLASVGSGKSCGRSEELTVKVWPLKAPAWPREIKVPGKRIDGIAGSSDRIVLSTGQGLHCCVLGSGQVAWTHPTGGICELKFSDDGRLVLASFIGGTFSIYDAQTGEDRGQESGDSSE